MSTHFTPTQARERQNELLATFGRMVDYANENNVNVILIAGDLLDTDSGNLRASEYVLSTIRANPSICFLYLVGNHDSNSLILAGDNLPKNLFTFGKKWRSYEFGNVVITGIEIGKNNNIYNSLVLDPNKINIVTLHGQEITGQKKDGEVINIDALKGKNIDYLALGHIHSYKLAPLDNRGVYCYPGCLEGRGFDECGEKGFVLLDITDKIDYTFVPFASREFVEVNVDITDSITYEQIKNKVLSSISGIPKENIMRVYLTGTYTTDTQKYIDTLSTELSHNFYFLQIIDRSTLVLPQKDYSKDISLAGEFVRLVKSSNLPQDAQEQILYYGLQAINGKEVNE